VGDNDLVNRTFEISIMAILKQNGFKILGKSRSSNATMITAKKGKFGGKKVAVMISPSDDLLETLNKERELHRKQGFKQKILYSLCYACEASFPDITVIHEQIDLSTALAS